MRMIPAACIEGRKGLFNLMNAKFFFCSFQIMCPMRDICVSFNRVFFKCYAPYNNSYVPDALQSNAIDKINTTLIAFSQFSAEYRVIMILVGIYSKLLC